MGRSRGGLSTKVHLLADEAGLPVDFRITAGQAAEYAQAISLLEGCEAEATPRRLHKLLDELKKKALMI